MFGPLHPRLSGRPGLPPAAVDLTLPGFGPFGTAGAHCFDPNFPAYRAIAALTRARAALPVLRKGRQYARPVSNFEGPFFLPGAGEIVAWSRILSDDESRVIVNAHGTSARGSDVIVDAALSPTGSPFKVVANSAETIQGNATGIAQAVGSS
jgi:hypothetical protein